MVRDGEERKIVDIDIGRARREVFDAYVSGTNKRGNVSKGTRVNRKVI